MNLLSGPFRWISRGSIVPRSAKVPKMPSRLSLSLSAALLSLGCADMLGLGGLTYDQGEGELTSSAGGAMESSGGTSGGAGGSIVFSGSGGVQVGGAGPGETSLLFDREAQLAALPLAQRSPEFFIFEPGSQEVSHAQEAGGISELVGAWTWPSPEGVSHLAAVPFSEGVTLIRYDRASGATSQATLTDDGEFQVLSSDIGTSGRTSIVPLFTGAEWLAFAYSAGDGNYRYFRPLPASDAELFAGVSEPGWTSIARFTKGDDVGVLKHNDAGRQLQFDRFVALGEPFSPVFTVELDETFSHMITFGEESVLLYQAGSGLVVTGRFVEQPSGTLFVERERGHFPGDLSQIEALSGARAVTFSAASGRAVVRSLEPLEQEDNIPVR